MVWVDESHLPCALGAGAGAAAVKTLEIPVLRKLRKGGRKALSKKTRVARRRAAMRTLHKNQAGPARHGRVAVVPGGQGGCEDQGPCSKLWDRWGNLMPVRENGSAEAWVALCPESTGGRGQSCGAASLWDTDFSC